MRLHHFATVVLVIAVGVFATVHAQQTGAEAIQLREEIARLSAIDRDPSTLWEIRNLNRSFLDDRKSRLRALLEERFTALQTYRRLVSLNLDERRTLDESIRKVERELQDLNEGSRPGSSDQLPFRDPSSTTTTDVDTSFAPPAPAPAGSANSKQGQGSSDVTTIRISVTETVTAALNAQVLYVAANFSDVNEINGDTFDANMVKLITAKEPPAQSQDKDYCIVHVVLWVPAGKVQQDAWFLYEYLGKKWQRQKDYDGKRIYGSKRVAVLLLHLNVPDKVKDISYKVAVNKKAPAPLLHLTALLGAISAPAAPAPPKDLWAEKMILVENVPSDIVVSGSLAVEGEQAQQLSRTYDNEGRYRWDVSLGVPVKTIRELQFVSDGNKITTAGKDRQDVYGFLNIYPIPVDVSGKDLSVLPHLMFGVPLASKPLHHPFAGIGYGIYKSPIKFNVFAGVIFNRERVPRTLTTGSNATSSQLEGDLHTRWIRKFTWGISFPVGQIKDAIKK